LALADPNRSDLYHAGSVDARAIEQGGKGHAIELFNANHPAWSCWAAGPFNP